MPGIRHRSQRVNFQPLLTLAAPAAFSLQTASTVHSEDNTSAGPATRGGSTSRDGGHPGLKRDFVNAQVAALLKENAGSSMWAAAAVGSHAASGYQLASGKPIMEIGGYSGDAPAPRLEQFQHYVSEREIHYFITGGAEHSDNVTSITQWVMDNYDAIIVGNTTIYDLTVS
jgi:ribosomal protein S16